MKKNSTAREKYRKKPETSAIILHIEDNEGLNLLIQKNLRRAGFRTEGVLNGDDALKKIIENPDRILLLDYLLPDMSGKDLLRKLRRLGITVPFIVLTGQGNESIAVEMMKLGASDYLIKGNGIIEKLPLVLTRVIRELESEKKLKRALSDLKESESKYHTLFAKMSYGLAYHRILTDSSGSPIDYLFLDANSAFEQILGLKKKDIIGKKASRVFPAIANIQPDLVNTFGRVALKGSDVKFDLFLEFSSKWYSVSAYRAKQNCFVASFEDITGRKELENKLRELSLTDELTGLNNRRGFFALADQRVKTARRENRAMLLLSLDVDNLKQINDKLGHKEGDRALVDTADFLKKIFREEDILARIGGDEFAVLQTSEQDTGSNAVAARFREGLKKHNSRTRRKFRLSISFGEARYIPRSGISIEELLAQADSLMYEQKKSRERSR